KTLPPSDSGSRDPLLIAVVPLAFAPSVASVWVGIGLWRMRNWARRFVIFSGGFSVIATPVRVLRGRLDSSLLEFFASLLGFLIAVWILCYMFQPTVKQAFGMQEHPAATT